MVTVDLVGRRVRVTGAESHTFVTSDAERDCLAARPGGTVSHLGHLGDAPVVWVLVDGLRGVRPFGPDQLELLPSEGAS